MTVTITSSDFLVIQLPNNNGPNQRYGHTAATIGSNFYIFGGTTDIPAYLNGEFWKYSLNQNPQWTQLTANGSSNRYYTASATINSDLFIIGGYDSSQSNWLKDLWKYNSITQTWVQLSDFYFGITGHTCVAYNQSIFVFGGQDSSGNVHNNVYQYDVFSDIWSSDATVGGPPQARYYHTASIIGPNMFIFGGTNPYNTNTPYLNNLWQYNVSTQTWQQLASGPPGRIYHSSVVVGFDLIIFGGFDVYELDDFWRYDLTSNTWTQLFIDGPSARDSQAAAAIGANMLIFGGQSAGNAYSDFWDIYLQPVTLTLEKIPPLPVTTSSLYTLFWNLAITNSLPFPPVFNITSNLLSLNAISSDNPGVFYGTSPSNTGTFPITITATIPYFNLSVSDTINLNVLPEFNFEFFQVSPSPTAPGQNVIISWNVSDTEVSSHYQITILRSDGSTLINSDFITASGSVSDIAPNTPGSYQYTAHAYSIAFNDHSDKATTTLEVTQVYLSDITIITNPISAGEPYQIYWTTLIINKQPDETSFITVIAPNDDWGATTNTFTGRYTHSDVGSTTFIAPTTPGVYILTFMASDEYGSTNDQTIPLVVKLLVVDAGPDQTIYYGSDTILGLGFPGSDVFYTWIPSDSLSNPNALTTTANPLVTTTYTVTAFDSDVQRVKSDSTTITVVAPIGFSGISITPNLTCAFNPQPITIAWTVTPAFPTPYYTITIRHSDQGLVFQSDYSNVLYGSFTTTSPNIPGNTTYYLTATRNDYGGLSGYGSDTLYTVQPQISAAILPDPTPSNDPYIIQWTATALGGQPSDTLTVTITTPTGSFNSDCLTGQMYQNIFQAPDFSSDLPIMITANYDPLSCRISDVLTLHTRKVAVSAGSDQTINYGSSTALGVGLDETDITYTWSPAYGLNTTNQLNVIASPLSDTTYTVIAYRADVNRYASDTVTVHVVMPIQLSDFSITPNTTCPGANMVVTWGVVVNSYELLTDYHIKIARGGTSLLDTNMTTPSGQITTSAPSIPGQYPYTIQVTRNSYGFLSDTQTIPVNVTRVRLSNVLVADNPTPINSPYTVTWTVFIDNPQGDESVHVTVNAPPDAFSITPDFFRASYKNEETGNVLFLSPNSIGDFPITLTATDSYGCTSQVTTTISTTTNSAPIIIIPTAPTTPSVPSSTITSSPPTPILLPHAVILTFLFSCTGALLILVFLIVPK